MIIDPFKNIEASWDWCLSLLDRNIYEGLNIDFKEFYYDLESDDGARTFLKHVSAFANTSGGDIIFGVHEEGGRVKELRPVEMSDSLLRRYSSFLDKNLHPRMNVEIHRIPNPDNPLLGLLVIRIPESSIKPVAGVSNGRLIFARRVGESSELMTEHELSALYKARFEGDWEGAVKLNELEATLSENLIDEKNWLVISGRPRFPGNFPLNTANNRIITERFLNSYIGAGLVMHQVASVSVGYRCFVLKDMSQIGSPANYFMARLYLDGSFSLAMALDSTIKQQDVDFSERMPMPDISISEEFLTESLLTAFELVTAQAQLAKPSGELDIQAAIKAPAKKTIAVLRRNQGGSVFGHAYPSEIVPTGSVRSHRTSLQVSEILSSPEGRYLPVKNLLDGLLSNFGIVESSFFDEAGMINVDSWPQSSRGKVKTYLESIRLNSSWN